MKVPPEKLSSLKNLYGHGLLFIPQNPIEGIKEVVVCIL